MDNVGAGARPQEVGLAGGSLEAGTWEGSLGILGRLEKKTLTGADNPQTGAGNAHSLAACRPGGLPGTPSPWGWSPVRTLERLLEAQRPQLLRGAEKQVLELEVVLVP